MRSFAIVLLCIVVAAFGQKLLPPRPTPPPPPRTRPPPPPPPPNTLTDDEGNVYKVVVARESMELRNSTGSLVSTVLNSNGWLVVISSERDICIISDPPTCPRLCFELVPFTGVVPGNVLEFCRGRAIFRQVPVPCPEDKGVTVGPVVNGSDDAASDAALISSVQGQIFPVWPAWPKWSCCCRWRRFGWWPCMQPFCFAYNNLGICVNWGCAKWHWHWHWIQDCVCGYEWPFFPWNG